MICSMSASLLRTRAREMWEALAGVPVTFSPNPTVVVAPESRLCPRFWVGIVVIDGAAVVTAPTVGVAQALRTSLVSLPVGALTDPESLHTVLPVAETLGPATLAYLDRADFCPCPARTAVEQVPPDDRALRDLLASVSTEDVDECGLDDITSAAFVVRDGRQVLAAAGYCDWPSEVAHLCVLTAAHARGRGLARQVASAAVSEALDRARLPQWRARPEVSRRVARAIGFRELGTQLSIRVAIDTAALHG